MSVIGAIVAGIVGTLVMSLALAGTPQMGMPKVDLVGMLGSVLGAPANRVLGWVLHMLVGIVFAFIYAAVWSVRISEPGVTAGLVFGILHWLVAGLLIGLLSFVHAGMRAGTVDMPGWYMRNLGNMGFFAGLMSHVVFGLTVGLVYELFRIL